MFGLMMAMAVTAPLHFDCNGPITPRMSAAAILAQFGKDARRETLRGAQGAPARAVVLYPDDPSRRLEIAFWDDAQTAVESVTAGPGGAAWTGPLGLHAGSSLAEVVAANGREIVLSGFGWDYGGYMTFSGGGRLKPQGDCAVQIRFGLDTAPKALSGQRDLESARPEVKAAAPRIETLSIGWSLPPGVRVSN